MKGAIIALCIAIVLLTATFFGTQIYSRGGTIDIHLHDTYFVLSYSSVAVLVFLFLGTFFAIGGLLGSGFRSKGFRIAAIAFVLADAGLAWFVYKELSQAAVSFPFTS